MVLNLVRVAHRGGGPVQGPYYNVHQVRGLLFSRSWMSIQRKASARSGDAAPTWNIIVCAIWVETFSAFGPGAFFMNVTRVKKPTNMLFLEKGPRTKPGVLACIFVHGHGWSQYLGSIRVLNLVLVRRVHMFECTKFNFCTARVL